MRNVGPESLFLWTRGAAARETLGYLERRQIDTEPILSAAGLSRRQLAQEGGGVSVASQYRFLELAAVAANDSLLGFQSLQEWTPEPLGFFSTLPHPRQPSPTRSKTWCGML